MEDLNNLFNMPLCNITQEDYSKMTFDWLSKYALAHNFEVVDLVNELSKKFSDETKLEYDHVNKTFVKYEYITISKLQRLYSVGFHSASEFVDKLISKKVLSSFVVGFGYRVLNKKKYDKAIEKLKIKKLY